VERRDVLWLGRESEAEPKASAGPSVLIGQDAPRGSQQPGQGNVRFRKAIDPTPRDGKGLCHRILGIGLARCTAKREGQDGAVMLLEGGLEAALG
jgi:hypothetical protein